MKEVLPEAKHRNCAKHVLCNRSGAKKGKPYEAAFSIIGGGGGQNMFTICA